jgi:hypothetical protein
MLVGFSLCGNASSISINDWKFIDKVNAYHLSKGP